MSDVCVWESHSCRSSVYYRIHYPLDFLFDSYLFILRIIHFLGIDSDEVNVHLKQIDLNDNRVEGNSFGIESFTYEIYVCHKSSLLTPTCSSIILTVVPKNILLFIWFLWNLLFISCVKYIDSQRVVTALMTIWGLNNWKLLTDIGLNLI